MALCNGMKKNQETTTFTATREPIDLSGGLLMEHVRELVASCNDRAGSHVLWVDIGGGAHLDQVPPRLPPTNWARTLGDKLKFRYTAFLAGRNHVGGKASEDEAWVETILENLQRDWERDARGCVELRSREQRVEQRQPLAA